LSTGTSKGAVLIVEDDESVREYLRILLEQAGYSVIALEDGKTALAFLARVRVDVVLLDLMMPVLDGWTFAATAQANPLLSRLPIIVFSAAGERALPGVAATLIKPSSADEILATIARVLTGNRRRRPRFAARFDLRASASGQLIATHTRDVSDGGLSFDSAFAPRIGDRLRVIVDLAVHGVAEMEVEVRHVAPAHGGWHVGTQLLVVQSNAVGFDAELALLARGAVA